MKCKNNSIHLEIKIVIFSPTGINWVWATNSILFIPIFLKPDKVYL